MNGIEKLKTGDFNSMTQEPQDDGTVIITLSKRGEGKVYKLQVRNLNGENEEVLWEGEPPQSPIHKKRARK